MGTRVTELHCKEVICIADGQRLGFISDVELEVPDGQVLAIVVPGPCRFLGLFGRKDDFIIPWSCIRRIGPDIVLVDVRPDECRHPRKKIIWIP
ncbi:MAG: YlmC/YmxH family sporulation protein [Firmicutes bacterium]|nr:YlmC/YmxH family sporulation protein [Bacillota bacterium]